MQIQMQQQMNQDKYFIYKENIQAAIKRQGDADILMMTSITFNCLFMPYLPSVTRLFSSTFETIRNLVSNTKTHDRNNKIFLFIQFTLSCSCSTRKTKDSLQYGFKFPIFTVVFFFFPIRLPFRSKSLIFTYGSVGSNGKKLFFEFHNNNKKINGFSKLDLQK